MLSAYDEKLWGIILAGGDGVRLQDFLLKEFDFTKPKQFCNIIGTRSLYKHTLDRISTLIPADQILTVITEKQYEYIQEEFEIPLTHQFIIQPSNKETGPGLILPLLKLYSEDPEAIVSIFPSDHFILEENIFMDHVREAVDFISDDRERILLLGIKPYNVTNSYGIIMPGKFIYSNGLGSIFQVSKFLEKPNIDIYDDLTTQNYLWNTMVMIGKCETFIKIIQKSFPDIYNLFYPFAKAVGSSYEYEAMLSLYKILPVINFSKHIMEKIVEKLFVLEVENVFWSDWGEEDKILFTMSKLNTFDYTKNLTGKMLV